jgi:hypothetical protein
MRVGMRAPDGSGVVDDHFRHVQVVVRDA